MSCALRAFVGIMALLLAFVRRDCGDIWSVSVAGVLCSSGRATIAICRAIWGLVTNDTTFVTCSLELSLWTFVH